MKIAAAYIRVSTDDQVEYSPESQLEHIRSYAKRNGYILPEEFIFMDEGISGKSTKKRTEFLRMIGIAKTKPKPFDAILLWKFSRFARNREDSIVYKSMLRKQCGIEVISISESLGDDKMSILIEAMIEAMDEYYSINLAEEVRRGMTEKAKRGEIQTVAPFGYYLKDKQIYPKEGEAEIIQKVFSDFVSGKGMQRIAIELNKMGIRTHRGNLIENRTIEYWLHNPVYIGKLRWTTNGKRSRYDYSNPDTMVIDSTHEPLVSEEVYYAAQKKSEGLKKQFGKYYKPVSDLSSWICGIARCGVCGGSMSNCKGYLVCGNKNRGKCDGCGSIKTEKLEQITINYLNHALEGEVEFTFSPSELPKTNSSNPYPQLISAAENKLARLREAYLKGVDTLEEYQAGKATIESEIQELQKQEKQSIRTDSGDSINLNQLRKNIKSVLKILQSSKLTNKEKNAALRNVLESISRPSKEEKSFHFIFKII